MATKKTTTRSETKAKPSVRASDSVHEQPVMNHSMQNSPYSLSSAIRFANNNFLLLIAGVGLFVFGFVFGTLWADNKSLRAGAGAPSQQQAAAPAPDAPPSAGPLSDADWKEITKDPVFVIGDKNAKLTMVEFTDYQCPFCGRYFNDANKQVMENYVKTGKLKIMLRDQALPFHPNSHSSAEAVRCAVEQGKAEAMHDKFFSTQDVWTPLSGDAVFTKYAELANDAGLNGQKIVDCVKSGKYKAKVDADIALGTRVGAGGTPTFFIEKTPLVGAQPFTAFDAMIAEKLGVAPGLPNAGRGGN